MAIEEVISLKTKTDGGNSVKSLKQEIREAQADAIKISRQFGVFSDEATKAAKRVATLRDEMGDFQQRVAGLNPDRFQAIANITQGVAGGIQAATGAMALFGGESEEVQKTLVKVQGAIAFAQGIQQVLDLRNSFGAMAAIIRGPLVAAFTTLKGAIISTGIGALVVAIGFGIQALMSMGDEAENTKDKMSELNDEFNKMSNSMSAATENDLLRAKIRGASEKELNDIVIEGYQAIITNIDVLRARRHDELLFEEQRNSTLNMISKKRLEFEADQAQKARDKEKENYEKRLADHKKYLEELARSEVEFRDTMDALIAEQDDAAKEGIKNEQKIRDELEAVKLGARVKEQLDLQRWYMEQKENANLSGQGLLDLQELYFLKSAEIDEKFYKEEKDKADAKAAEEIAATQAKNKKLVDDEIKTQQALTQAKQQGYDAASNLFGNISQLFEKGSAEQKAFAIAQVLVDEAKSIAATIAGATEAAAATGPAAPIMLGVYIASGLAAVAANFKRVKDILGTSTPSAAPSTGVSVPQLSTISTELPGSDEVNGNMKVYVTEKDISRTQGRVRRNRNVSVI